MPSCLLFFSVLDANMKYVSLYGSTLKKAVLQHRGYSNKAHYFKHGDSDPLTIEGNYIYTVVCMHVIGTNSIILYSKKFIQTSHVQPDSFSYR